MWRGYHRLVHGALMFSHGRSCITTLSYLGATEGAEDRTVATEKGSESVPQTLKGRNASGSKIGHIKYILIGKYQEYQA